MKGNVLITGGSGFIGSHIVEKLPDEPASKVVVFDVQAKNCEEPDCVKIHGDVFDSEKLVQVIRDYEIRSVIHMVGLASIPDCRRKPETSYRLNVSSVNSILEAMRLCDVERLVFPSTAAVYGATNGPQVDENVVPGPTTVYGCHKRSAELLIRAYLKNYGFDPTILRMFNVYGDLHMEQGVVSGFLRKAMAGKPIIVNGGDQLRDFVFLDDVVAAFVKSLNGGASHGKIVNVGSGVGTSIKEIAAMVKRRLPDAEILYKPARKGEYSVYADISRLKNFLGCEPTPPNVGIPRFIQQESPQKY